MERGRRQREHDRRAEDGKSEMLPPDVGASVTDTVDRHPNLTTLVDALDSHLNLTNSTSHNLTNSTSHTNFTNSKSDSNSTNSSSHRNFTNSTSHESADLSQHDRLYSSRPQVSCLEYRACCNTLHHTHCNTLQHVYTLATHSG